ncbi:MAG: D-2-hydroxyacid dehydrogenase [Deltaproteobacteria bacterium]|nr:D-2-hydroxyacid dehydrogenase [Deltaproteobacteria bacterium]
MNKALILIKDGREFVRLLDARNPAGLETFLFDSPKEALDLVGDCNIILGQPDLVSEVLPEARSLQWVQSTYAGIEALCRPGLKTDYILTGVKDIFGPLMSEYVFAYILSLERHLFEVRENQTDSNWLTIPYRSLDGLTLGVCGLGSIGRHIARTARHFGMRVLGYKRTPGEDSAVDQIYSANALHAFVAQLDYLVTVLPDTPQTTHLFTYDVFAKMKPSSVFINVGRGNAVHEPGLIQALFERLIRAAVLDVFKEEPLPTESSFWAMDNVFVTPHHSAFSFPEKIAEIFCNNYERFCRNEPLLYVVDFTRGY